MPKGCLPRGVFVGECLPRGVSAQGVYTFPCGQTDRHLRKHNLSATTVADGNKTKKKHWFRLQQYVCLHQALSKIMITIVSIRR